MLRALRTRKHITQTDLSARIGYSHAVVCMYESGQARASRRLIELVVKELELTEDEHLEVLLAREVPWKAMQRREITWVAPA